MTNMKLANHGETRARGILRRHFTNVRFHTRDKAPFDYTGIDKLTGTRCAIEVKTTKRNKGKLAHIETEAMNRKLQFMNDTDRKGVVLLIVVNGGTQFYITKLQQHISKGSLVRIK